MPAGAEALNRLATGAGIDIAVIDGLIAALGESGKASGRLKELAKPSSSASGSVDLTHSF